MTSTGHMSVKGGKRVMVHLKVGESYIAKFKEKFSNHVEFYDHDSEPTSNIRTLSIFKGKSDTNNKETAE